MSRVISKEEKQARLKMRATMLDMRAKGKKWREIGEQFGLDEQTAWKIGTAYKQPKRERRRVKRRDMDARTISTRRSARRFAAAEPLTIVTAGSQDTANGNGVHAPGSSPTILMRLAAAEARLAELEQLLTDFAKSDSTTQTRLSYLYTELGIPAFEAP
jgi:hypothetical protein